MSFQIPPNAISVYNNSKIACSVTTFDPYLAQQGQGLQTPVPTSTTQVVTPGQSVLVTPPLSDAGVITPQIGLLWRPNLDSQTLPNVWRKTVSPMGGIAASICQDATTSRLSMSLGTSNCGSPTVKPIPTKPPCKSGNCGGNKKLPPSDGALPYAQWPVWAQALLWTGVSVAAALLVVGIIMLVRRMNRGSEGSKYQPFETEMEQRMLDAGVEPSDLALNSNDF